MMPNECLEDMCPSSSQRIDAGEGMCIVSVREDDETIYLGCIISTMLNFRYDGILAVRAEHVEA